MKSTGILFLTNVVKMVLNDTLSGFNQKFVNVCSDIRNGISKCRETCEYFALCGGGAPSNKLHENGTFDSTETMRCKLRIKALIDVCLEYLESQYDLDVCQNLSLSQQISIIREQVDFSSPNPSYLLKLSRRYRNQSNSLGQVYGLSSTDTDGWDDWDDIR